MLVSYVCGLDWFNTLMSKTLSYFKWWKYKLRHTFAKSEAVPIDKVTFESDNYSEYLLNFPLFERFSLPFYYK